MSLMNDSRHGEESGFGDGDGCGERVLGSGFGVGNEFWVSLKMTRAASNSPHRGLVKFLTKRRSPTRRLATEPRRMLKMKNPMR